MAWASRRWISARSAGSNGRGGAEGAGHEDPDNSDNLDKKAAERKENQRRKAEAAKLAQEEAEGQARIAREEQQARFAEIQKWRDIGIHLPTAPPRLEQYNKLIISWFNSSIGAAYYTCVEAHEAPKVHEAVTSAFLHKAWDALHSTRHSGKTTHLIDIVACGDAPVDQVSLSTFMNKFWSLLVLCGPFFNNVDGMANCKEIPKFWLLLLYHFKLTWFSVHQQASTFFPLI